MNKKKIIRICMLVCISALIAGCGSSPEATPTIDPLVIMTDVAGTIQAEITQSALLTPSATIAPPPTSTPLPIPTQPLTSAPTIPANASGPVPTLPAESPDKALYIEDVTYPDDTTVWIGEKFTKTWKIENTGTTTWNTGYFLVYWDGEPIICDKEDLYIFIENPVEPNNQITLSVRITTPHTLGTYTNYFRMSNDKGQFFGDPLSVKIKVVKDADLVYPRW